MAMYSQGDELAAIVFQPDEGAFLLTGGESHWHEYDGPIRQSDGWTRMRLWQPLADEHAVKFAALLAPLWEETYPEYVEILLKDLRERHERLDCRGGDA